MPPPLIPTWGYGDLTPPPGESNKGGSEPTPPHPENNGARPMFTVERREVGKLIWESLHQEKDIMGARIANMTLERIFAIVDDGPNYEWRIREVNDGRG